MMEDILQMDDDDRPPLLVIEEEENETELSHKKDGLTEPHIEETPVKAAPIITYPENKEISIIDKAKQSFEEEQERERFRSPTRGPYEA